MFEEYHDATIPIVKNRPFVAIFIRSGGGQRRRDLLSRTESVCHDDEQTHEKDDEGGGGSCRKKVRSLAKAATASLSLSLLCFFCKMFFFSVS